MNRSLLYRTLSLFVLIFSLSQMFSIDIPLFIRFQYLQQARYNKHQENKELSWTQRNLMEFGVEDLSYGNLDVSMSFRSEEHFVDYSMKLHEISIRHNINSLSIGVSSSIQGYGSVLEADKKPILLYGMDPYKYQQCRLTGATIGYESSTLSPSFSIGGNNHNQAIAVFSVRKNINNLSMLLSQDIRSFDNHWRTPSSTTAFDVNLKSDIIELASSSAITYLPEYKNTRKHNEYFNQNQVSLHPQPNLSLIMSNVYLKQGYDTFIKCKYNALIKYSIGDIHLIPLVDMSYVNNIDIMSYRIITEYDINSTSSISTYYDYSYLKPQKSIHSFGIAANLYLSF